MDPRTAYVLAMLFALLNGGILGLMHRGLSHEIRPAAVDWRIGTLLAAGGVILLAAQSPDSAWLLLPVGNACLLFGITLYWRSVRRFDHLTESIWLFVPAMCATLALTWFTVVDSILWIRVLIACIGWSIAMLASAYSLLKHRTSRNQVGRIALACILISLSIFMIFRAVYFALHMRAANSILTSDNWINILTPLSAAALPVIGTTAFLVMCSERLRAELALRAIELNQKNIALTRAIQAREDAERIARHDLKTPLASIAATSELIRSHHPQQAKQDDMLRMIEHTAKRAVNMVNLSLDLYRMENGTYQFQAEVVDLAAITGTVIEDLRAHADSKRICMQLLQNAESSLVLGNASLCYSCIANLVKNAVEAASDQSIVKLDISSGDMVTLQIHNDTPVPLSLRERFFEKYATEGKVGGNGLGTYSSQLMASVQGGQLTMQTSDTDGTRLRLSLQRFKGGLNEIAEPSNATALNAELIRSEIHVLVVDDDIYNCKVLCNYLSDISGQVATALNGRYAIERVLARRPDLIFMDIEMPIMGGIQAMQAIRDLQRARRQTASTMIAFSSDDNQESHTRFLALGFDLCLSKPASEAALRKLISEYRPTDKTTLSLPFPAQQAIAIHANLLNDVGTFIASRLQILDQLIDAGSQHDHVQIRSLSHKLSGSFAMYGFAWAAAVCKKLESSPEDTALILQNIRLIQEHLRTVPIIALNETEIAR